MDQLDNEKFKRVWERVNAQPGQIPSYRQEPNLEALALLFRQAARDSHILSRRLRGRHGVALTRMSRQAWENYRIVQQMLGRN